jgi:ribosome-binding protein aMBF1 (putative translation factor)
VARKRSQGDPAVSKRRSPAKGAQDLDPSEQVPSQEELDRLVADMEDASQWDWDNAGLGPGFYRVPEVARQFAEFVAAYRAERGLTQQEFARLVCVLEGDVAFMESGHYTPDVEMLVRFGRHLRLILTIQVTPAGASLSVSEAPAAVDGTAAE